MDNEFDQLLQKFARVAVKIGLNLQPGQRLMIGAPSLNCLTPISAAPLVRHISDQAYMAGARLVEILWGDDEFRMSRLKYAPPDTNDEYSSWQVNAVTERIDSGSAFLAIFAHDPDFFEDCDQDRLGLIEQINTRNSAPIRQRIQKNATNWLIISAPVPGWAAKIFPNADPLEQDALLWDVIFNVCRVKAADPLLEWQRHVSELAKRCDYLNSKRYSFLHYKAPGTDLTVGLPEKHVWKSGQIVSQQGIPFIPNMPTEEVFTTPHAAKAEGVVSSTKPLNFGGGLVEKFSLILSEGKVVSVTAEKGQENLRHLLETDDGARRLGEVALVPHSSPISQSGLVFYNILLDENASCHIALGNGLGMAMGNGEEMSDEEFIKAGGNRSVVHADFMIGSADLDVDGLAEGKAPQAILRGGEWVFSV